MTFWHRFALCQTEPIKLYWRRIKGYLCYKTITPQNVLSGAQVKNFLFRRKIVPFSRYSDFSIFSHPMI